MRAFCAAGIAFCVCGRRVARRVEDYTKHVSCHSRRKQDTHVAALPTRVQTIPATSAFLKPSASVRLLQSLTGRWAEVRLHWITCCHPVEEILWCHPLGIVHGVQSLDDHVLITWEVSVLPVWIGRDGGLLYRGKEGVLLSIRRWRERLSRWISSGRETIGGRCVGGIGIKARRQSLVVRRVRIRRLRGERIRL